MIRMGPHGERAGSSKRTKGEGDSTEDQEAMDLAADWSDISQGLRKDLGQQLHSQWIRPIQVGSFCKETGTLDLFLPTEFSANWVSERFADRLSLAWKIARSEVKNVRIQVHPGRRQLPEVSRHGCSAPVRSIARTSRHKALSICGRQPPG